MSDGIDRDSWRAMMEAVQAFHDKHRFRETGGEEMTYRVALMAEELGEISACVTKGKPGAALAEEVADLLILVMGTAIAQGFSQTGKVDRWPTFGWPHRSNTHRHQLGILGDFARTEKG